MLFPATRLKVIQIARTQTAAWLSFDAPVIAVVSLAIFFGLPVGDFAARIAFFFFGIPTAAFMLFYRIIEASIPVSDAHECLCPCLNRLVERGWVPTRCCDDSWSGRCDTLALLCIVFLLVVVLPATS